MPLKVIDQLADRRGVPGQRAAGRGFLERRLGRDELAAEKVAVGAGLKLDRSLFEVRILIFAGPNPHASDHRRRPSIADITVVDDRSMGLFNWQEIRGSRRIAVAA